MKRLTVLLGMSTLGACGLGPPPPAPAAPPAVATVRAPASRTWDAAINVLGERNIPIRSMERSSGIIETDPLGVDRRDSAEWADCGKAMGMTIGPERAAYNVVVGEVGGRSTVKVTVRWTLGGFGVDELTECTSRRTWEAELQSRIKALAERGR